MTSILDDSRYRFIYNQYSEDFMKIDLYQNLLNEFYQETGLILQ